MCETEAFATMVAPRDPAAIVESTLDRAMTATAAPLSTREDRAREMSSCDLERVLDDLDQRLADIEAIARTPAQWDIDSTNGRSAVAALCRNRELAAITHLPRENHCELTAFICKLNNEISHRNSQLGQIERICNTVDLWNDWRDGVGMILAASGRVRRQRPVSHATANPAYL